MAEDLAAEIEHHFLAGPLHIVGLQELEPETEDQQSHIDRRDLRNARDGARAEPAPDTRRYPGRRTFGRKVAINRHFDEIGSEHVGE